MVRCEEMNLQALFPQVPEFGNPYGHPASPPSPNAPFPYSQMASKSNIALEKLSVSPADRFAHLLKGTPPQVAISHALLILPNTGTIITHSQFQAIMFKEL